MAAEKKTPAATRGSTVEHDAFPLPDDFWGVKDMNARRIVDGETMPRSHEPTEGITYKLYYDRLTLMRESHARVFLKDPAFKVYNNEGQEQRPLLTEQLARTANIEALAPNFVIADLDELTTDALLTRVAQVPGGSRFSRESKRDAIVAYLSEKYTPPAGSGDNGAGAGDLDDMDDRATARLLEGV